MADRRSVLVHLAPAPAGGSDVVLTEVRPLSVLQVRAWPDSLSIVEGLIADIAGSAAPAVGCATANDEVCVAAVAPGCFIIAAGALDLAATFGTALPPGEAAVTDLSHGRAMLRLQGERAAAVLTKCLALDLDMSVFPPGRAAATAIHNIDVLLHRRADSAFDLLVPRSLAESLAEWILDAGLEYGIGFIDRRAPMTIEASVARHYSHGRLERAILDALIASGKDIDALAAADLSAADEFHLGWRAATVEFAEELGLAPGMRVLDIGSGIGGPARYFADAHGCVVTGIDLTTEFVDVANALTRRCGLADKVSFQQGSALSLPFPEATFDVATLIHVGMNIEDKPALFGEARRVLKLGGRLGVYDIMRLRDDDLPYPTPWAASAETSFVESVESYRDALAAGGFVVEKERNRREFALRLATEMREKAARDGVPPLGPHIVMGPATPERLGNVMKALEQGIIAPVEIVARAA